MSRWPLGAAGAIASASLHFLVVGAILSGSVDHQVRVPDRTGAGASAMVSASEPVMTLILIDDPSVRVTTAEPLQELASRGAEPTDLLVTVASPDPFPAAPLEPVDTDAAESAANAGSGWQSSTTRTALWSLSGPDQRTHRSCVAAAANGSRSGQRHRISMPGRSPAKRAGRRGVGDTAVVQWRYALADVVGACDSIGIAIAGAARSERVRSHRNAIVRISRVRCWWKRAGLRAGIDCSGHARSQRALIR